MSPLSERALLRRLKRHLLKETHAFFAVCAPGFEAVLENEITGLHDVTVGDRIRGGVSFSGPLDTLYHANLRLATAHRVLLRISDFLAQSYPMLYNHTLRVPWELYLGYSKAIAISAAARESRLNHRKEIVRVVYDGIRAQLEEFGLEPELSRSTPLQLQVRLHRDRCTLSLDTSGEHLHRRGYRTHVTPAPLRETLAASVLLSSAAGDHDLIVDPFCGSGTLVIEAARLACNIPPGLDRSFGFEEAPFFNPSKWDRFRRQARSAIERHPTSRIVGSDVDPEAVSVARTNAGRAGALGQIELAVADARDLDFEVLGAGAQTPLLVGNVPYGGRLGDEREAVAVLRATLARLKETGAGWKLALVTKHPDLVAEAGMQVDSSLRFSNGGLAVHLVRARVPH